LLLLLLLLLLLVAQSISMSMSISISMSIVISISASVRRRGRQITVLPRNKKVLPCQRRGAIHCGRKFVVVAAAAAVVLCICIRICICIRTHQIDQAELPPCSRKTTTNSSPVSCSELVPFLSSLIPFHDPKRLDRIIFFVNVSYSIL